MSQEKRKRVLIVGDSITLGVAEANGQTVTQYLEPTYVQHLREITPDLRIDVDAAPFRTTTAACKVIEPLLLSYHPGAVLVMLGGNDADIDWRRFILSGGRVVRNNVPVERFAESLRTIVRTVSASGATPVLVDVPNHDLHLRGQWMSRLAGQDVSSLIEQGGGQAESDRRLAEYNRAVRELALESEAPVASWARAVQALPPSQRYGPDFTHPGPDAHRVIAETIAPVLTRIARGQNGWHHPTLLPNSTARVGATVRTW
ncbi:MAG: SGNH/GDSL hydrolase family protein [Tepidisphaerales bacterium]